MHFTRRLQGKGRKEFLKIFCIPLRPLNLPLRTLRETSLLKRSSIRIRYSFRSDCTGLAIAALRDCQLMVSKAIIMAISPASRNMTGPMLMR